MAKTVCVCQVLPGSHRDPRNPRGPNDHINPEKPIPGEFQIAASAGSVLVQDTRTGHAFDNAAITLLATVDPSMLAQQACFTAARRT